MVQGIEQLYEGMFLVNAATAAEDWAGVIATIERIMERSEAEITKIDKWDERRLCYNVAGQKRGTYILCYFKSNPAAISKIERDVQLNETVLRVLILRADQIPQLIQDIPTPFVHAEQQKQAVKVAAESEASSEVVSEAAPGSESSTEVVSEAAPVSDLTTEVVSEDDEPVDTSDDATKSEESVAVPDSDNGVRADDVPDILEPNNDKDNGIVEEKPRTGDIDDVESQPS